MGRSLFVVNTPRERVVKVQFRRVIDELRSCGTKTEGPFSDRKQSLAKLTEEVRARMKGGCAHPLSAAIATLAPQNIHTSESSWLSSPFILNRNGQGPLECDSAGSIASGSLVEGKARGVDIEGLTMISVAVLRRLGVDAFFSYLHYDNDRIAPIRALRAVLNVEIIAPTPTILVIDNGYQLVSMLPPYMLSFPTNPVITSLEVLDDEALFSVMKMKMSYLEARSLMSEVIGAHSDQSALWKARARIIGHTLYRGMNNWTEEESRDAIERSESFIRMGGLESAREIAFRRYAQKILVSGNHIAEAMNAILCPEAIEKLREISGGSIKLEDLKSALDSIPDHPCTGRLKMYYELLNEQIAHLHRTSGCEAQKKVN